MRITKRELASMVEEAVARRLREEGDTKNYRDIIPEFQITEFAKRLFDEAIAEYATILKSNSRAIIKLMQNKGLSITEAIDEFVNNGGYGKKHLMQWFDSKAKKGWADLEDEAIEDLKQDYM